MLAFAHDYTHIFITKGNSALHIAVKTKAPVELLESFYDVYGSEPFYKVDADDNTLLYVALTSRGIDPKVVKLVATAAPLHAKSAIPKSGGTMPAIYAAQNGMPDMIVKHLLLMDMPIVFGGKEQVELKLLEGSFLSINTVNIFPIKL